MPRSYLTSSPTIGNSLPALGTLNWPLPCARSGGGIFAETMQGLLERLLNGEQTALSDFMQRETQRDLGQLPVLAVPGSL